MAFLGRYIFSIPVTEIQYKFNNESRKFSEYSDKGETRNEENEEEELRRKELESVEMELVEKKSDDSETSEESEGRD